MNRLLITGCSGFLGSRVRDFFLQDPDFTVLTPSHTELDITSPDSCRRWFEQNLPDSVIHLAAISDIGECDRKPEESRMINVRGPVHLAACAKEAGISGRFLFASSDQVYTANRSEDRLNCENDTLNPENLYGREKAEAEEKVLALLPEAMALRFAWMFDLKPGKMNYLKNLTASVQRQEPACYATNELRSESYAYEVAENMRVLLRSQAAGGAYNFGSAAFGSSYDTALRVYEVLGRVMHRPVEGLAIPVRYEHPRSLAMDQTKLRAVGISFRNTVEAAEYCLSREADLLSSARFVRDTTTLF